MPSQSALRRARKKKQRGLSPTTQAGEFVREEIEHIRQGKHGAKNTKQAIAIGLSEARRAGVKLPPPPAGTASARKQKRRSSRNRRATPAQSRARLKVLKREGRSAASKPALARHARQVARRRRSAA